MSDTPARPTFSIVMPTRNRARLLEHALGTALAQGSGDLEVVVVDNHSSDDTAALVASMADPRLRYLRTERALVQHDNWELAVAEARGEWVLILADDDALVPSFLHRLAQVVARTPSRAVSWGEAVYFHPDFEPDDRAQPNTVYVDRMDWTVEQVDCASRLGRLYTLRDVLSIPAWPRFGETCAVRRDALDEIRATAGRLFHPPSSDTSFAALLLGQEPSYTMVHQPWVVRGLGSSSLSTGFQRRSGPEAAFAQQFGPLEVLHHVPVPGLVLHNIVADSLLEVQRVAPKLVGGYRLDWARYYVAVRRDLDAVAQHAEVDRDVQAWRAALRSQPGGMRRAVATRLAVERTASRARLIERAVARRVGWARELRGRWRARHGSGSGFALAQGDQHGFADIGGAAEWVECHVLAAMGEPLGPGSPVEQSG